MKELFKSYYQLTEEEFKELWGNCTFVFDSNTLLNLYRYPETTREVFLEILQEIKQRLWIPYQVAFEYHKNLNEVLYTQNNGYTLFQKIVDDSIKELISKIDTKAKELRHTNITTNSLLSIINKTKEQLTNEIILQQGEHPDLEDLKERLNLIIGDQVGRSYTQEELDKIYGIGEGRYSNLVPPGFKDLKDKQGKTSFYDGVKYKDEYGDLVYWFQIIEKAKNPDVDGIILISDDTKEDWIYKVNGQKKGIHPELMNEFRRETEGKLFYLYNSEQFIKHAKKYLLTDNQNMQNIDDVITDIKVTKQSEELIQENNKRYIELSHFVPRNISKSKNYNNSYKVDEASKRPYYYYVITASSLSENHEPDFSYIIPHIRKLLKDYINLPIKFEKILIENLQVFIGFSTLRLIYDIEEVVYLINKILLASKDREYSNVVITDYEVSKRIMDENNIPDNIFIEDDETMISEFLRFKKLIGTNHWIWHDEYGNGKVILADENKFEIIVDFNNLVNPIRFSYPYSEIRVLLKEK
ncbi:PIN-like domain-containing protein [Paenibacillus hunanensis]|uniref:PIN like domain-containing protein n=1 Tax=Paenibacillus hunanensis TaxID=539262 RepID=A0ABU1IW97_9BACL|nr:PIN-like domain-containing protein [Paenibacillus hunanensis]MDR6243534.1 hypothetical protein [Paenibacillus hunanensis]GGI98419.1 hypothetical protein GCM10008022_03980 [Paenibacillus hunanensis]